MYHTENKEELPYSLELFLSTMGLKKAEIQKEVVAKPVYAEGWKPKFQGDEVPF